MLKPEGPTIILILLPQLLVSYEAEQRIEPRVWVGVAKPSSQAVLWRQRYSHMISKVTKKLKESEKEMTKGTHFCINAD